MTVKSSEPFIHSNCEYPEYSHYDRSTICDKTINGKVVFLFSKTFELRPTYYFHFKDMKFFFEHNHPRVIKKRHHFREIRKCDKKLKFLYELLKSEKNILETKLAKQENVKYRKQLTTLCKASLAVKESILYHQNLLK